MCTIIKLDTALNKRGSGRGAGNVIGVGNHERKGMLNDGCNRFRSVLTRANGRYMDPIQYDIISCVGGGSILEGHCGRMVGFTRRGRGGFGCGCL